MPFLPLGTLPRMVLKPIYYSGRIASESKMKISFEDLYPVLPSLGRPGPKTLLHVGCGTSPRSKLPSCFLGDEWAELRLDIDKSVSPDIVASLIDMSPVRSSSIDAIWSSHSIEHLEGFEVAQAFQEFHRVLRGDGFLLATLPDLGKVASLIVAGKAEEVIYVSPAGPITALDMIFGHQASIARGKNYMAHRTGFTAETLQRHLTKSGFEEVRVMLGKSYDIWVIAKKSQATTLR